VLVNDLDPNLAVACGGVVLEQLAFQHEVQISVQLLLKRPPVGSGLNYQL